MYAAARSLIAYNPRLLLFGCAAYAILWNALLPMRLDSVHTSGVATWWMALCAVTLLNIGLWRLSASVIDERKQYLSPELYRFQRWQLILAAVYVFGCAFRAILPRADVQRMGLVDSWLSSVMMGRSVATIAEICFVIQWALMLNVLAKECGSRLGLATSWLLVPMIVVAEVCSWYAVLTTCYLGNVIEESLWTASALLLLISSLSLWPRCRARLRPILAVAMVLCTVYVVFMCMVDVPMYASRWLADQAAGREYLTISQGLWDVWSRRHVSFDWAHWQAEIPWMSLYFSAAVWCSIALCHLPVRIRPRPALR